MTLETSIELLAQAIVAHAQATIQAAQIYAAAGTNGAATNPTAGVEPVPAEETPAPAAKKTAPKKTKAVETPADPDVEKEVVKEEDTEEPRKPAKGKPEVDVEKLKDEIREVFKQLSEIRGDLPIAVLKEQGQQRLSTVPADELPAILLAAKDKLKSVQADQESYE